VTHSFAREGKGWGWLENIMLNCPQRCQFRINPKDMQTRPDRFFYGDPRCKVSTMEQVISMDESEVKEITTKSMDLTGQLADLFGQGNTDTIHQAIEI